MSRIEANEKKRVIKQQQQNFKHSKYNNIDRLGSFCFWLMKFSFIE